MSAQDRMHFLQSAADTTFNGTNRNHATLFSRHDRLHFINGEGIKVIALKSFSIDLRQFVEQLPYDVTSFLQRYLYGDTRCSISRIVRIGQ